MTSNYTPESSKNEIPFGYCHCGCGQKTKISPYNDPKHGYIRGKPRLYLNHHQCGSMEKRFWNKVDILSPDKCWNWKASLADNKYGHFSLYGRLLGAHKVAYIFAFGEIPEGLFVCHHCDNPSCCNPNHMFLGTSKQNSEDMVAKRRVAFGERSGQSVLKENQVLQIRKEYEQRVSIKTLSERYFVSKATIRKIVKRETWKHI